jgi:hypothetical protein
MLAINLLALNYLKRTSTSPIRKYHQTAARQQEVQMLKDDFQCIKWGPDDEKRNLPFFPCHTLRSVIQDPKRV